MKSIKTTMEESRKGMVRAVHRACLHQYGNPTDSSTTGASCMDASSSSSPTPIQQRSDNPLVVTLARITFTDIYSARVTLSHLLHIYSASDFAFVDDSWLPNDPGSGEENSDGDDDDFSN